MQQKSTFYGKIAKYFTEYKTDSTRSVASLTTRWGTINRETVKFVGSLAKIEAKNESGTTAHDKIEKAKELFKEIHGAIPMLNQVMSATRGAINALSGVSRHLPLKLIGYVVLLC
ncbi:hypothetical protein CFP56_006076 [Quercus suber]|uniref:Uncharacterized protein n=1 Tax=Quercus suber TaxID=58331 RepID=A0AAW0LC17_QUESU